MLHERPGNIPQKTDFGRWQFWLVFRCVRRQELVPGCPRPLSSRNPPLRLPHNGRFSSMLQTINFEIINISGWIATVMWKYERWVLTWKWSGATGDEFLQPNTTNYKPNLSAPELVTWWVAQQRVRMSHKWESMVFLCFHRIFFKLIQKCWR